MAILQTFLRLTQEAGEKFASRKIIKLTTVAKALHLCFLLPFELCVNNFLHNWSFTKPNSVYIYICWVSVCSQCAYLQCIELCWVQSNHWIVVSHFDMKVILCFWCYYSLAWTVGNALCRDSFSFWHGYNEVVASHIFAISRKNYKCLCVTIDNSKFCQSYG